MSGESFAMPPFRLAAASLRRTTERLAREVVRASALPPEWSELDWAIACAAAAMQGISTLLANRLRWSGPPIWESFLAEQQEQGRLRHAAVGVLLERIDDAIRRAGISAVALKGSAIRRLDLYAPGERPMGDVDLLVQHADMASIERALRELDYVQACSMRRHVVFEPRVRSGPVGFGEHIDNALKIEVHATIAELLPVSRVDITSFLWPADASAGLNTYPGVAELMLHLLLHAAGSMRRHTLRQIQLHDIAVLSGSLSEIDWRTLLGAPGSGERRWWLFPPLALAARYYADSIPSHVIGASRSACPRWLGSASDRQSLTDVSWSNLRIYAFPGIAWARTPMEALRFIRSRLMPSRIALTEIELARALQPQLDQLPWYNISHGNRILRWIFSRPPRVQTMTSLRAALESAASARNRAQSANGALRIS